MAFGYVRLNAPADASGESLSVRVVQPSIDMSEKWDASVRDRIFRTMLDLSGAPSDREGAKPQLILWPETSVPFFFTERPDALVALGDLLHDGQMLIAGAMREEGGGTGSEARFYNSVVAIDAAGEIVDAVDKVHLVPFGEYIPFSDLLGRFGLEQLVAGPMNLAPGNERHSIALPGGTRALPFICYEIIFPALVAVDVASTDIIVNVTNDAWFGDTPGPYQHFRQAQIRAVETGLPLIRAANTGISGVVDQRGRIVDALSIDAQGVVDATIPLVRRKTNAFWEYSVNGLVILFCIGAIAAGLGLGQRSRPN